MLSIAHTLVSLPFAFLLENPFLMFLGAFLMHFLLDTLPHWNLYPEKWGKLFLPLAMGDVIGGVAIALLVTGSHFFTFPVLLVIFAGNLPDILHTLWELGGKKVKSHPLAQWSNSFFHTHDKLQLETVKPLPGLISQVIVIFSALVLLANFG